MKTNFVVYKKNTTFAPQKIKKLDIFVFYSQLERKNGKHYHITFGNKIPDNIRRHGMVQWLEIGFGRQ